MEYAEAVDPRDEVVEDKGVRLLIDPKAVLFLLGTEMDYRIDKLSASFVFNNPNQTGACGCGELVAITPAKQEGDFNGIEFITRSRPIDTRACRRAGASELA